MGTITDTIKYSLEQSRQELDMFMSDPGTLPAMEAMALMLSEAIASGNKVICCGNGGSLCDATHFAEELTGRFRENRRPFPAMAINDPAYMTCTGNDFSFDTVFSRWVEAFGQPGDVLLAISTSGNSRNVTAAAEQARRSGMKVIALASGNGGALEKLADIAVLAPAAPHSDRVQEIHIKVIHMVIEAMEQILLSVN